MDGAEGYTIQAKITKTTTLDSDGIVVFRVADKTKKLVFTASKEGEPTVTKEFDLSGLTLQPSEAQVGGGTDAGGD